MQVFHVEHIDSLHSQTTDMFHVEHSPTEQAFKEGLAP